MAELFKFRCYQCETLIGAPPSRYGSVVKCPKCGVELIVPSPEDDPETEEEPPHDAIRPEDLGINFAPEPTLRPQAGPLPPVGPDPIAYLRQVAESGESPGPDSESEPETDDEAPGLIEPANEPLVNRRRGVSRSAGQSPRARDMVLPRTVAVAWALFALLSLAFAFTSGLLIGQRMAK